MTALLAGRHSQYLGNLVIGLLVIGLLAVMYVNAPSFFRVNNLINVLVQASILGTLAIGLCFVFVGGGIDLSLPATMAFAGIIGAMLMRDTQMVWIGPLAMLAVGSLVGAFNGFAVGFLSMKPFVVTLATMTVVGGFSIWITASQSVFGHPYVFEDIFLCRFLSLPVSVWVFFLAIIAGQLCLEKAPYGQKLRAVGYNERAALIARVSTGKIVWGSYVIAGAAAGLTAIFLVARLGSASAKLGSDALLLDVISACVIGRVSIYGGIGTPLGVALGALVVTLITNSLNLFGISFFASLVVKGAIILLLVYIDTIMRRRA
ncbi:ABC transporter permease [Hoeflea prorocentri]|uniref:ABC transporter permease n=1 Tax=Hoeflea prorocentri TaxID=1922333 RepID=A0A9X3ZJF2_9HYPH|nr:ABC transporter permease [Hoeflea prorocentri]MCY6383038.1 ABC transporter permease [Hoeflea prorocentri]MDA5400838.1 ABC transporter permease [Hoeflea prorocentri]